LDKLSSAERQTLARAQRSTSSKYGRKLLRQRGQHIERSFAHVLDAGGLRRATLRGLENLNKRHQIAAACYNLSQLKRRIYGVGTPKQWAAFGVGLPLLGFSAVSKSLCFRVPGAH
jgi:transposase